MVALVIRDREKVRRAIQQLRRQYHFEKEFKSHKTPIGIRLALLKMAVSLGLSFDVMVVDKKQLSATRNSCPLSGRDRLDWNCTQPWQESFCRESPDRSRTQSSSLMK